MAIVLIDLSAIDPISRSAASDGDGDDVAVTSSPSFLRCFLISFLFFFFFGGFLLFSGRPSRLCVPARQRPGPRRRGSTLIGRGPEPEADIMRRPTNGEPAEGRGLDRANPEVGRW